MKVGVVGGSGFIGSHLVDKLVEEGHEVTVFDIMRPHREDVRHVTVDLLDFHRLVISMAGTYDAIYLLAAMANVDHIYKNPVETSLVNIQGVANVIEAMRRYGGRLILASTVWVYNLAADQSSVMREDSPLLVQNVNHTYTASKVAAELLIHSCHQLYDLEFTILRYGIPYGPRGREGTLLTNFVQRGLKGQPISIFGDGAQARNFIYVEDLAAGNVAALQENAKNQIFNLDGMRPVTIKEVAETVGDLIDDVQIDYLPGRPGDHAVNTTSSNEKALELLGWAPEVDLKDGVKRYLDWYRTNVLGS